MSWIQINFNPPLPLNAHQTSLSARTLNNSSALQAENTNSHHNLIESGFNEITLSNLKEQEHIYIQAQRDYEELIKHNFTQTIQNNKESQVEGTYNERIKKIHTQTIDLAKIVSIGGEYNTNVALSKDTIVGLSHTLNVGVDNKVRIAKDSSEYVGEDKEEKQIAEIYFYYGKDKIKLRDISRHSQDINLHIRTQGYSEGEEVEVKVKKTR